MKKFVAVIICGFLLTSCRPLEKIFNSIANFFGRTDTITEVNKTFEVTSTLENPVIISTSHNPTPKCIPQATTTPEPTISQVPGGGHRFIMTKLPP